MTTPNALREQGLLSTGDVAKHLGCHRSTVWHYVRVKRLLSVKVGSRYVGISRDDLKKSGLENEFRAAKRRQMARASTVSRKRK